MSVRFERPLFLLLAGLAPFAAVFARRFFKAALTVKLSLGPHGGALFKPPGSAGFGAKILLAAEIAAVPLILLAIANPMEVTTVPVYKERGADITFILDISPSMAVLDINNAGGQRISRFEAARLLILSFVDDHPAAAIGLVAVGEESALLVPPTIDHTLFRDRLQSLRIGELGDGTALGMGLSLAAYYLHNSRAPLRACVLVTDGENNAGPVHPETAAEAIASADVSLFVIGIGSGGETILDYVDPQTNRHRRGLYDSRYDTESLARIAEKGDGIFLEARTGDELGRAFFRVSEGSMFPVRVETLRTAESRAGLFIAAALAIVTLSFMVRFSLPGPPL
ncbi:MAG: VWA domain-containing protein [Spirochaetaceae bacterium]|jgi:Ca-activated chloride channel family protein|nr:VWA domain-containing protein [Spirochaetaceae bacterium]